MLIMTLSLSAQNPQEKPKCKAITKSGVQCKNNASEILKDDYCRIHSPQTPKCGAKTKAGTTCKMLVNKTGDKCKYHKEK